MKKNDLKNKLQILFIISFTIFMVFVFTSKTHSYYFEEIIGGHQNEIVKITLKNSEESFNVNSFLMERNTFLYYEVFPFGLKDLIIYEMYNVNGELTFEYIRTNENNIIGIRKNGKTTYYEEYF